MFYHRKSVISKIIRAALRVSVPPVADAENYLVSEAVIMPVFYENSYFVTSKKTSGIYFYSSADNVFFHKIQKKS